MADTPNLGLPEIAAAQAQKHVTHNEALRTLDTVVQLAVVDRDLATSPGGAADGDRYVVAAGASGDWAGHEGEIAARVDGGWRFVTPRAGFVALALDEAALLYHTGAGWTSLQDLGADLFRKADPDSVVFSKTGSGTIELKAGTVVTVAGGIHSFASATPVTMPALAAGTDYAVYVCADGSVRADADPAAPLGYTTANSRKIGGFHHAPGGNAAGVAGGDTTPAINPYSMWDLRWRPACPDPRGMALVAGSFWCDVYLLGVDHDTDGTSRHGATIADGTSPPKIPAMFGGDGTATYSGLNWWQASEVMRSHGKALLRFTDFAAAAYGASEAQSRGNDPVTTGLGTTNTGATNGDEAFTSRWGVVQAAGVVWTWANELGGPHNAGWQNQTGGRGQVYNQPNPAILGGYWTSGGLAGTRAAYWDYTPWGSAGIIGARGRAGHLRLT